MDPREISPELVLVDPDLAARARAALPEHPWPEVPRIVVEVVAPAPAVRRSRFPGTLGLVVVVVLAFVGISVLPTPDRPTFAEGAGQLQVRPQQQPPPVARPQVVTTSRGVTTLRAKPAEAKKRRATVTKKTQKVQKTRKTRPAPQRPRAKRERRRPATRPQTPPTRAGTALHLTRRPYFAWPRKAGAVYYQVRFLRNGHLFYTVQTTVPRLRFPPPIRFPRGRYRWIVRPAIRAKGIVRLGKPIVDSTFRINRD